MRTDGVTKRAMNLYFAPVERTGYAIPVPKLGRYEEVMTTDKYEFGGKNKLNEVPVRTKLVTDGNGKKYNVVNITVPPLGGLILKKQQN